MWFRKDPNSCRRLQSVRLPWSIRAMSKPKTKWSPWLMTSATQNNPMKLSEREVNACCYQPPPQALRFSHGRGERETRVTGDEPQGTMGRVQTAVEASLCPSRLPLRAHFHQKRDVWVRGSHNLICCKKGLNVVGKTRNMTFDTFCSNVPKQVARFCCRCYDSLRKFIFFLSTAFSSSHSTRQRRINSLPPVVSCWNYYRTFAAPWIRRA